MPSLTIKFEPSVPQGARKELRALLEPHREMLAREVRVVRVGLKEGAGTPEEAAGASTMTLRRYHFAVILLSPSFFGLEEDEKAEVMAHEATHVVHDVFAREVACLLELIPEEMRGYVAERLENAEERAIDALSYALYTARKEA